MTGKGLESRGCPEAVRLVCIFALLVWACSVAGCGDSRSGKKLGLTSTATLPPQVTQFTPVKVQFELSGCNPANPYDRDEVTVALHVTSPDGTEQVHPGFFTVDHRVVLYHEHEVVRDAHGKHWEIRWTPTQPGEYQWAIVAKTGNQITQTEGKSVCAPSDKPGFVRVSKSDPQYFELSTGEFFYPIGHVLQSPSDSRWRDNAPENAEIHDSLMAQRTFAYEKWFEKMAANNENFCSIWMAPWWLGIEWSEAYPGYEGIGRYNQMHAAQLDRIFEAAELYGIRILLFTMNHGQLATVTDAEWDGNPYRKANGGPVETASEVFDSDACDKLFEKRLDYILARWGYSPSLFGISISSETDWVELYYGLRCDHAEDILEGKAVPNYPITMDKDKVNKWLQRLSRYIRKTDVHGHIVTTQFSQLLNGHDSWELPELEFVHNNCYEHSTDFFIYKYRESDASAGIVNYTPPGTVEQLWAWNRLHDYPTKPKLVAEWGGSFMQNTRERLDLDLHTGLWALAMDDCAGVSGFWWWNEVDHSNLYPYFHAIHQFVKGYDRRGKHLKSTFGVVSTKIAATSHGLSPQPLFTPHPSRAAIILSNETEAFAYVYHELVNTGYMAAKGIDDIRFDLAVDTYVSIPDELKAGRYRVEFWDTFRGTMIESREQVLEEPGDDMRRIEILPVRTEVAIKMVRLDDTPRVSDARP